MQESNEEIIMQLGLQLYKKVKSRLKLFLNCGSNMEPLKVFYIQTGSPLTL